MSDSKRNGRPASRPQGLPGPDQAPPKRRRRLPVQAELTLDDALAVNPHHPLAQTAPEIRTASRLRVIAGVLARLVRTDLARRA